MKTIASAPLGKQTPPGHSSIERPMDMVKAARLWGRNNPDPASVYARRMKRKGTR